VQPVVLQRSSEGIVVTSVVVDIVAGELVRVVEGVQVVVLLQLRVPQAVHEAGGTGSGGGSAILRVVRAAAHVEVHLHHVAAALVVAVVRGGGHHDGRGLAVRGVAGPAADLLQLSVHAAALAVAVVHVVVVLAVVLVGRRSFRGRELAHPVVRLHHRRVEVVHAAACLLACECLLVCVYA